MKLYDKFIISGFVFALAQIVSAQNDTLLISTDKYDDEIHSRFYVIDDTILMAVHYHDKNNDTVYIMPIPGDYQYKYERAVYLKNLRKKDVSNILADEVFDYFSNMTEQELLAKLSDKMVAIDMDGSYLASFYNDKTKKNEVFSFQIWNGRVGRMTRPSTNTLPTNNVWMAFQILEMKEYFGNVEELVRQLKKMYSSKQMIKKKSKTIY